jgi:flagellar basal-body rod modification protein FlgD
MAISAVSVSSSAAPVSQAVSDGNKASLNYNSFLRLLVAEMKNQDPTAPKDTSQYMTQLASFSSVEQGVNSNKKLDALMTSIQLSQAHSLIGHILTDSIGTNHGIIRAVEIGQTTSTAVLESGERIELGAGYIISTP